MIIYTNNDWSKKYFDKIIFEPKDKVVPLKKIKELAKREKFIIINDKIKEIKNMEKILGEAHAQSYIIRNPYNKEKINLKV